MNYPDFFSKIETITLKDDLSQFLGAFGDGLIEFSYLEGLKSLYGEDIPKRGEVSIYFNTQLEDGVTGVIASVFSQITGATDVSGFKGLNGNFIRHSLLSFDTSLTSQIVLTRKDNQKTVKLNYNPSSVKADERLNPLMKKLMSGNASLDEKKLFGQLWQKRVEDIFTNKNKVIKVN